jgi:hypothetical protein
MRVGLVFLVWLRFALHSIALWRVCAFAPGFVSGWRACSSVSLCNSSIYRSMYRPAQPSTEVVYACSAPRVWVWGFWLGFALRCVALLNNVCVRLHLLWFQTQP